MAGAGIVGDMLVRVETAYAAGCDMLLVCNAPDAVGNVLANWKPEVDLCRGQRLESLIPLEPAKSWEQLQVDPFYRAALQTIADLMA